MKAFVKKHTLPMVSVLGIASIPLLFTLPAWIAVWCFCLWAYAISAHMRNWPWPNRVVRLGLTVVGCILAFVLLGKGRFGGNTFVGLLAIMAGLKPFENEHHRDRMMTLLLVYFTIISSLFVIENLLITLYMFFSVFIATASLIHFNYPERPLRESFRLTATIMGQAIPAMILLFVFFPRMEGTFFALRGSGQGRTGFNDTVTPGSVSRLVRDQKIAFRAEFKGELPPPEALYWRGLVLWDFDGTAWERGITASRMRKQVRGRQKYDYDITIEPHRKKYLFALDLPATTPAFTQMMVDHTLVRRWPLNRGFRYHMRSYTDGLDDSSRTLRDRALRLPAWGSEKSRALAQGWAGQNHSAKDIVDQAMNYLRTNNFQYTLNPPLMRGNPVDEFLFENRQGYCEHFASAFAFLMRAAGVPARVVVGYLGGDRNPYGNYLIVRQYHAHAWTEVWLADSGWTRVDPTTAVAPERVSVGLTESLMPDELPDFLARSRLGMVGIYLDKVRFMWDAVNLRWNAWFMEYSRYEQTGLWARLWGGLRSAKRPIFIGSVLLVLVSVVVFWVGFRRLGTGNGTDPVVSAYALFCRKLEKVDVRREPSQGPRDFAQKAALLRSDLREPVQDITQQYIDLRYAGRGSRTLMTKEFVQKVKRFHPSAHRSEG